MHIASTHQNLSNNIANQENPKVENETVLPTKSSNLSKNKIPKYFISFKKPATIAENINLKKSITKKVKPVTKKQRQLGAAAEKSNYSILKYALPIKNTKEEKLSSGKESASVDKES